MKTAFDYWLELGAELAKRHGPEVSYNDAAYYHEREHSISFAASMIIKACGCKLCAAAAVRS